MQSNMYDVPRFKWTQNDEKYNSNYVEFVNKARQQLPEGYFNKCAPQFREKIEPTPLYKLLQCMPKGVVTHNHYDCNEDLQFYAEHIATDPTVFLSADMQNFHVGNSNQAEENGWLSMFAAQEKFQTPLEFHKYLLNMTCFNSEEVGKYYGTENAWPEFEKKINKFFPILEDLRLARKYFKHICLKYIKNGFDRIEFRILIGRFIQYDQKGNYVAEHNGFKFKEMIDDAMKQIQVEYPEFDVGFIAFGLKVLPDEENEKILRHALDLKWDRLIGIDFVQEEDPYGSLAPYDALATKILKDYPNIKKVYHAGQTKKYDNNNIQIAIKGGSVRIGHGCNVLYKQVIKQVIQKKVCFQHCPASNVLTGYIADSRQTCAPLLLNMGVPIAITPDDPGKFNCRDATFDVHMCVVSYDWTLKQLKLSMMHSINHSICSEQTKNKLAESFHKKWDQWVSDCVAKV